MQRLQVEEIHSDLLLVVSGVLGPDQDGVGLVASSRTYRQFASQHGDQCIAMGEYGVLVSDCVAQVIEGLLVDLSIGVLEEEIPERTAGSADRRRVVDLDPIGEQERGRGKV